MSDINKNGNGGPLKAGYSFLFGQYSVFSIKNWRTRFPGTLGARMTLALSLPLLLSTVIATAHFASQIATTQMEAQQQIGRGLISLIEPAIQHMAANNSLGQIDALLQKITSDPAIQSIRISDRHGAILYEHQHNPEGASWLTSLLTGRTKTLRSVATEFAMPENGTGRIELALSYRQLNDHIRQLVLKSMLVLGGLLAGVIFLTHYLVARFTSPLKPLTELARQVSRGNWIPSVKLIPSASREIQELNQAFADGSNTMRRYINSLEETRELLEKSEKRLRTLVNGMREILLELDTEGRIVFLNPAWETLTGFAVNDTLGHLLTDYVMEKEISVDLAPDKLSRIHEKNREICIRNAAGKRLWLHLDADAQHDASGDFTGVIATLGDITQSVELNKLLTKYQDDLYFLSITDPLTGLYNRRHFDTQLDAILSDHLSRNQTVCLLIIDLDGFKFINDTYGHPSGDEALRAISALLKKMVRSEDYVARLAGDEFAMILKKTSLENARIIAQKLHDAISETYIDLPIGHFQLQSSIGVAAAPIHGQNAQDLISAADVALYHSKRGGRNRVEVLSPDISKALMSIFSQGFQLRTALEQGNLMPAFQPICDIKTGEPVAYEALARMHHGGAMIKAGDFITVAEELGLTREIDLHIIEQSLRLAPVGYGLFLNLDPRSFSDPEFVKNLTRLVKPACKSGRSITIEITERESVIMSDTLLADIGKLRKLGCKLALDDFGSGYSTYHFLNLFQPEYLKIEGTFVRGMLDHEADRKIVSHIHELATSFGIQTIAESVENEETRSALLKMGIRNAQGWHMGSPQFAGSK